MDISEEFNPSILIVDDVAENIKIVAGVLKDEGYNMAFATKGSVALEIARRSPFDIVLLDVMMPEMDGFEVCRQLKEDPRTSEVAVIFNTAKTDVESIIRGFEVGGSDYVTKPFNAAELLARVRTHVDLKIHQRKLQYLNAAKDRFISIISNELKGPFVGLGGVLRMLDDEFEQHSRETLRDYIGLSRKASDQMLGLIDNLLSWATMQSEGLPCHPVSLDVAELVNRSMEDLKSAYQDKGVELEQCLNEPIRVRMDAAMGRVVFRNLLHNAMMFSYPGERVMVSAERHDDLVMVDVIDKGIGMSVEQLENLYRLDRQDKRPGTQGEIGTGMGLILSRELLDSNDGKIEIDSMPGKGTRVRVSLPVG